MGLPSWSELEPASRDVFENVSRLLRRAARRPFLTLAIAVFVVGYLVTKRARAPESYTTQVVFRITESNVDPESAPRPAKELKEHVLAAVFSDKALLESMDTYKLYLSEKRKNPADALNSFREDLEVEAYRNYFLADWEPETAPRSARLSIAYTNKDPRTAYDVAHHLALLVVQYELASRKELSASTESAADDRVMAARTEVLKRKADMAKVAVEAEQDEAMLARLELEKLRSSLAAAELRLAEAERAKALKGIAASVERAQLGLRFEIADWGKLQVRPDKTKQLIIVGLVAFLLILPLTALGVGAFDSRLYEGEDVRRLGIELLGHVPNYAGDNAGTMGSREKNRHV